MDEPLNGSVKLVFATVELGPLDILRLQEAAVQAKPGVNVVGSRDGENVVFANGTETYQLTSTAQRAARVVVFPARRRQMQKDTDGHGS